MTATIRDLEERVAILKEQHGKAASAENEARKATTAVLNELNQAMRDFDNAVEAFRKSSPRGSDWAERMRGV